jgi:hypothetical protein
MGQGVVLMFPLILTLSTPAAEVEVRRTPNGGIQPQVAVDESNTVHLIYFKGTAEAGDVFYVRKGSGDETFSEPIRVNSQPGSAMAVGTIRGAHLAVGKNNRVHVAWMGSAEAKPEAPEGHPMLYTRLNEKETGFETQRNLVTWATGLDGGGSIAADGQGRVYVAWHAGGPDNENGEAGRAVYVARSEDSGKTFARENRANPKRTGACGCCGMRAYADSGEGVHMLYRTAQPEGRDMTWLVSHDRGEHFEMATVNPWAIQHCPMSSAAIAEASGEILLATEKENRVAYTRAGSLEGAFSPPIRPIGSGKRHPPALAVR